MDASGNTGPADAPGAVWAPRVTVAAVIERDGRFLLVRERVDGRVVLNQPAGHLERGETLIEAVCREVHEETGARFTPTALIGVYPLEVDDLARSYLRFCFTGTVAEAGALTPQDAVVVGIEWLTAAELAARRAEHRSPLVAQVVADHLAGRHYPLALLREPVVA